MQPGHRHVQLPPLPPRVAGGTPMHPGCSVHGSQGTPWCGSHPPRRAAAVHDGSHPQPLPTGAYTVSDIEYMRMCKCLHTQHVMCTCACASSWRWVDWRRQPTLPQCKPACTAAPCHRCAARTCGPRSSAATLTLTLTLSTCGPRSSAAARPPRSCARERGAPRTSGLGARARPRGEGWTSCACKTAAAAAAAARSHRFRCRRRRPPRRAAPNGAT